MMIRRSDAIYLRIELDPRPILTESPAWPSAELHPFANSVRHLIRVAADTGRMSERDVMLLYLTHTAGIRVTKLALLRSATCSTPAARSAPRSICGPR